MGERRLCKAEVVGSIPISSTKPLSGPRAFGSLLDFPVRAFELVPDLERVALSFASRTAMRAGERLFSESLDL